MIWLWLIPAFLVGAFVLGLMVAAKRLPAGEPIEQPPRIVRSTAKKAASVRQSTSTDRGPSSKGKRKAGAGKSRRRPLTKKGALRQLDSFGIKERDFDRKAAKLSKRFGMEAAPADVAWGLYRDIVAGKLGNKGESSSPSLYYGMALFLDREGRSGFEQLQIAARMGIQKFQRSGVVKKLRICTGPDPCEACQRQDGRTLTFARALKEMPIPCKACTSHMQDEKLSFCGCRYEPVLD